MAFDVLSIRSGDEPPSADYPTPGDQPDTVALHPGEQVLEAFAVTMLLSQSFDGGSWHERTKLPTVRAVGLLTNQRVAVACTKYDTGSSWSGMGLGGLAVAGVATAVSRSMAARRRVGKMLVGHLPHERIQQVQAKDRTGLMSSNSLVLLMRATSGDQVSLAVELDKSTTATALAERILAVSVPLRAARIGDDSKRDALLAYGQSLEHRRLKSGFEQYRLPA